MERYINCKCEQGHFKRWMNNSEHPWFQAQDEQEVSIRSNTACLLLKRHWGKRGWVSKVVRDSFRLHTTISLSEIAQQKSVCHGYRTDLQILIFCAVLVRCQAHLMALASREARANLGQAEMLVERSSFWGFPACSIAPAGIEPDFLHKVRALDSPNGRGIYMGGVWMVWYLSLTSTLISLYYHCG